MKGLWREDEGSSVQLCREWSCYSRTSRVIHRSEATHLIQFLIYAAKMIKYANFWYWKKQDSQVIHNTCSSAAQAREEQHHLQKSNWTFLHICIENQISFNFYHLWLFDLTWCLQNWKSLNFLDFITASVYWIENLISN